MPDKMDRGGVIVAGSSEKKQTLTTKSLRISPPKTQTNRLLHPTKAALRAIICKRFLVSLRSPIF